MAFCENSECTAAGLRKDEVERDIKTNELLCHECYASRYPGWKPPKDFVQLPEVVELSEFNYEISLDSTSGLRAKVAHGDISLTLKASTKSLKDIFGVTFRK